MTFEYGSALKITGLDIPVDDGDRSGGDMSETRYIMRIETA